MFEFTWLPSESNLVDYSAFVYGAHGLALRLLRVGNPPNYYGYVYDPFGSLIAVRQREDTSLYKATRYYWYDAFGQLIATQSSRSGLPTLIEPMGYLAQYGVYTDREISGINARSFPQIFLGSTYYDPVSGRVISRSLPDANPYAAFASGTWTLVQAAPASDEGLDLLQSLLDVVGIVDPTGLVDLTNAGLYAARGKWEDAAFTAAGVVPYMGDLAKLVKWGAIAVGVGFGVRTTYKEARDYLAFRTLRRQNPDQPVDLWHFTDNKGKEGILQEGEIRSYRRGLWAPWRKDLVYFGASPRYRFIYMLPREKRLEVVHVQVAIRKVWWRPFGIRLVPGPVPIH